jgi:hypothetical protein
VANFGGIPPLIAEVNRSFVGKPIPADSACEIRSGLRPTSEENLKSLGYKSHFEIDTSQKKMERWNPGMMGNTAATLFIGGFDLPIIPLFHHSAFPKEVPHGRYFPEV